MGRRVRQEQLEAIWETVREYPGARPAEIASRLGLPRSQVTRSQPAMDEHGLYLSEDERGGLWPFWRRKKR